MSLKTFIFTSLLLIFNLIDNTLMLEEIGENFILIVIVSCFGTRYLYFSI